MHFWTRLGGVLGVLFSLFVISATSVMAQDQQVITPSPRNQSVAASSPVSVDIVYDTNPTGIGTSGLGVRIFFNSQQLAFNNVTNILSDNLLGVDTAPSADAANEDGDPNTDMFISGAWAVIVGPLWPPNFPSTLFRANFTTAADFNGSTGVNLRITQAALDPVSQNSTINFAVGPQPPVAVDDTAAVAEDRSVTVGVLENDTDPDGDPLTVTAVRQGDNGAVTFDNASVTYTPNENFNGTDTFTYTVSDGTFTDRGTVTVTVNPRNDPPTAVDDTVEVPEDTATPIMVLANDTDIDGDAPTVIAVTQGANGTVTFDNASVTYTSNRNFVGTDTFTYTISDGTADATATVNVTVTQVNDNPNARDNTATTSRNRASAPIAVLGNDSDVDGDTLQVTGVSQGTSGSVTFDATSVTYTPNTDFVGTDTFTYTIGDGNGGTDTATVTIEVLPNNAPVAVNDSATTAEDTPVSIAVLANDTDADGNTLSIESATPGASGTTVINGTNVTYTPNTNSNGNDTFTYTVSDSQGGTATGTVNISVTAVNDAPVVPDRTITVTAGSSRTFSALAQATDVEGDTLSIQSTTQGANGTVTDLGDGRLRYRANRGPAGTDTFTVTISDGQDATTATVNVTIEAAPNTDPVAVDDTAMTSEEVAVSINVLENDTDADDGDVLTVASVTQPTNGTTQIEGTAVVYTPNAEFLGDDSFTYTVNDDNSGSAEATVTVTVVRGPRISSPPANAIVAGSAVAVANLDGDVIAGTTAVLFQFRRAGDADFTDIGTAAAPAFFIVAWDTTAVEDGNYELQAVATVDNNQVRSILHPVRIDNARPGRATVVEDATTQRQRIVAADTTKVVTSTGVVLDIEPGALAEDDRITIAQENAGPGLLPGDLAGFFFNISFASGQNEFPEDNPLTISIPYADANNDGVVDDTNLVETNLTLWFFDETTGFWEQVVGATVNPEANVLTAMVDHLTPFAVFQASETTENPLAVVLNANSPAGTITVDLPVADQEVARLRLTADSENVNVNRVRVLFSDQSGEATIFSTMTVRLIDTADGSVLATQTLTSPVVEATLQPNPAFVLATGSVANLSVRVDIAPALTQQGALGGPQSPATQFAWLLFMTPALGLVFFPSWRRNSTRFWIGLLVVAMFCSMMLTACPEDDTNRTFTFTAVIPAGSVTGQSAISGNFAAPQNALTGLTLIVQE